MCCTGVICKAQDIPKLYVQIWREDRKHRFEPLLHRKSGSQFSYLTINSRCLALRQLKIFIHNYTLMKIMALNVWQSNIILCEIWTYKKNAEFKQLFRQCPSYTVIPSWNIERLAQVSECKCQPFRVWVLMLSSITHYKVSLLKISWSTFIFVETVNKVYMMSVVKYLWHGWPHCCTRTVHVVKPSYHKKWKVACWKFLHNIFIGVKVVKKNVYLLWI